MRSWSPGRLFAEEPVSGCRRDKSWPSSGVNVSSLSITFMTDPQALGRPAVVSPGRQVAPEGECMCQEPPPRDEAVCVCGPWP